MIQRTAQAAWKGTLEHGQGTITTGSADTEKFFSANSRFGQAEGTNPEEMIGGALAGCYSMALAHAIQEAGYEPEGIETLARVSLNDDPEDIHIARIHLTTEAKAPGIEPEEFERLAHKTSKECPVARALAGAETTLEASLLAESQP